MAIALTIAGTTVHVGDTVRVHYKIIEKDVVAGKTKKEKHEEQKERTQIFEGMVIAMRGTGNGKSFIVRRIGVANVGIERIFPVISPWVKKVEIKKTGDVRRAKLYFLRQKSKKEIARMTKTVEAVKTVETAEKPAVHVAPQSA